MGKFFTVVCTLIVVQLVLYYHEVSSRSCRAIYGEEFRCISPDACALKNRVWKTRCGPKDNGVCCQIMNEHHRNFKSCGIRVQRHAVHRQYQQDSSLKHFEPYSQKMENVALKSATETIDIPMVILGNKDNYFGGNLFQKDYFALNNPKQEFYKSRKNSDNQKENNPHAENSDDDRRYSVKNYVENSSETSRNSTKKIEIMNETGEVSTNYGIQLNDTLYANDRSITRVSVDLLKITNSCVKTGCSTDITKSIMDNNVTEASNETPLKLKGNEEISYKSYGSPTKDQINIIDNNKNLNEEGINQFKNDNSFNALFEDVANSIEAVTNTIMKQNSEESSHHSLGDEGTLNNSFDIITTDKEQFNYTNEEYNDNETRKNMENATKLEDEVSSVEAIGPKEKGNLEDDSDLLKKLSSEYTVAVEKENTSKEISEFEQKTDSENFVEVTNGTYSSQELKSEETINTQNTFELLNESSLKLVSEYENITSLQDTHYTVDLELAEKAQFEGSSELVTESSLEEKTVAGKEDFSDTTFQDEKKNISKPYSDYEKALSQTSIQTINESSLTKEFESEETIIVQNTIESLNENSSISESEETTNVQENAELTKEEHELEEKTNLESSSELVTEIPLEQRTISGEETFSEATTIEGKKENISKSDSESKEETISNISIENSFSQGPKSEETINVENTFELSSEDYSEFVSESEKSTHVRETDESTNLIHYKEEFELEKNTVLNSSNEIMTASSLEERAIPEEKAISETTSEMENISKPESESEKTISEDSVETTNINSSSQESLSEEPINVQITIKLSNENSSKLISESEEITNVQGIAELLNETNYKEQADLEEKTNLEGNSEFVSESSLEERTISGEENFYETTVEEKKKNISKPVSQSERKIFVEISNKNSLNEESKSEDTVNVGINIEFQNENSSILVSESKETTNVQEIPELSNETKKEEGFSGIKVEAETKNIAEEVFEFEHKTNIQSFVNETSSGQVLESEVTINSQNTFELPIKGSSDSVVTKETTSIQETVELTDENKTNLDDSKLANESSLEDTKVEAKNTKISKVSQSEEKSNSKTFFEVTNEKFSSQIPESEKITKRLIFVTEIIPEATVTTINEDISVNISKSEDKILTESNFKLEHEHFYNGIREIPSKRDELSDERFYKEMSEPAKEEKFEEKTEEINENVYKEVSESVKESRIDSKTTIEISNEDVYKDTPESRRDSYQEGITKLVNENTTNKTTVFEEKNNSVSVTQSVNGNISNKADKYEQKTIWETIVESVTKMFSKQVSESEETNLVSTVEMSNEGYSKIAYEYEKKANQKSTESFYKDVSEFKKDTNEEKTNTEIAIDVANENSYKNISEMLLDTSTGISSKVEYEEYHADTSEMEETVNPLNNSETAFEGFTKDLFHYTEMRNLDSKTELATRNSYKENTKSEEETYPVKSSDLMHESTKRQMPEILADASMNTTSEMANENMSTGTFEAKETTTLLNKSETALEGYPKYLSNHTAANNLDRKIELTTGNSHKESTESEEETDPMTSSDLINESTKREVLDILVDVTMKTIGEMANENIFTDTFESEKTANLLNYSEIASEGYPISVNGRTESTNVESNTELTNENSYKKITESVEGIDPKTTSGLINESINREVPKILMDASMKTTGEIAIGNISIDAFESEITTNLLNTFEIAPEGYPTNVSEYTEKTIMENSIQLTNGNSYKEIAESDERANTKISSDLIIESTNKEVSDFVPDESMKTTEEMVKGKLSRGAFEYEGTINSLSNSETVFEGFSKDLSNNTEMRNLDNKTELTAGSSYKESTKSEDETHPLTSFDLMHESSKGEVPGILVTTSMKIAGEIENENISTSKFESEETKNPLNNSETVFEDYSKDNAHNAEMFEYFSKNNTQQITLPTSFSTYFNTEKEFLSTITEKSFSEEIFSNPENVIYNHKDNLWTKSNVEQGNTNSYNKMLDSSPINNENLSTDRLTEISNGISHHFIIEDETQGKSYGTTTEEEVRLSKTAIKYYDGRENVNPGYTNEKEFQNSYTEISEYSTNDKNNLGIEIFMSSSNKTSKTFTEVNNKSESFEIPTKDQTDINRTEIIIEKGEENATIFDLGNQYNNSSKVKHESLVSNTNITMNELLTEVLSENITNVSYNFDVTAKYQNHFRNTERNGNITSQNFVVNEHVASYKSLDSDIFTTSITIKGSNSTFNRSTEESKLFSKNVGKNLQNKILKDTDFYISESNSKIMTGFTNTNSYKNISGDNVNVSENVTSPISIDNSGGRFSHVIDGNKNFVITTEKQFHFDHTETELYEKEENISPQDVVEFENSSANVEMSEYGTNNIKIIKYTSVDVNDDENNTQKEAETHLLNLSGDIDKGILVKNKYTVDSLKHDFTSKYNTYSAFVEQKYHKYPDETIPQFMKETTVVPLKREHADHLHVYKDDMHKMSAYHKDNTKLQSLKNINKYYDYGGQSFNGIRLAARDEYHKAYSLSKILENQPAFLQKFQHPMFYQNPNFMNEKPIIFPGPYYGNKVLQPYAQSYPSFYDQFNVNYPFSQFYQAGLYQQPFYSHSMAIPLPNNYRPYYGSENFQLSVQEYPLIYNRHDLRMMYPNQPVDFSTFHQAGFYRQPNPMYMIANPSLRRYRRSYGSKGLQDSVQPKPSILKEYSSRKIEEKQSTDLSKYYQVGLNRQLNPTYRTTEPLLNRYNIYLLADSKYYHPRFVERHLNTVAPFTGKGQLDEFENKENGILREKPEMSYSGTDIDSNSKQHIKNRKYHTKRKLRSENRSLSSVVNKRGIELPAFTRNSNKFSIHKNDTFSMERTEEPFREAYREFIDRFNRLHLMEYLPPEKTYRKRIFKNQTLEATGKKGIKQQTVHYSLLDKIFSTSTDFHEVPTREKYFTSAYNGRKNDKHTKDQSEGDKLIEISNNKGRKQKEELKPIKRNLNSVLISETQNTSQRIKNSNSHQENTLNSYLHENVTLFNDLDVVLNDAESFPVRTEVQKTNVRRSNVPGISHYEANLSEGRTIGGKLEYENWPWIVSIYRVTDMFHICSGTLIDDRHILSAAHCFIGKDYESFVASVGNLMKITHPKQGYEVEDKIVHLNFTMDCYCNDIALLRLKEPVDDHLTPICLSAIDTAVVGEHTTLLGWGDTEFMEGRGMSGTDRLQRLNNLPITSSEECRQVYSRILHKELSKNFTESYVCAGVPDGSKDACVGDSGGPLLHRSYDGSWTLLGVVSFGYKCGMPGVPGIYTRVSYYLKWIYDSIDRLDLSHLDDKRPPK